MEDFLDPKEPRLLSYSQSGESGLASTLLGAAVFLASPIAAILAAQIWAHGHRNPDVVLLHAWLIRVGVGVPLVLLAGGFWLGCTGIRQSKQEGHYPALAVAGLLLNSAGLCGWVTAGFGLLNTTESMVLLAR